MFVDIQLDCFPDDSFCLFFFLITNAQEVFY